ncbi:low temperature requirement protein A [Haloarcula sp. S1CR25-12]|uniref:Low temperature requirement protein A n=1 Tax=Haloarcula saliterrae TaxID=2950534 RepID=A0ABU2FF82_9EURY|nr:low temperature requirement protein A [Haloarcula sp. S1CR25-12]MDS0260461.1 low temperature requirement protein A [Haloarcula sp. S1CR25-12]
MSSRVGGWCQIPVSVYSDTDGGLRHASWLELFLDLVFVVAVAALGAMLHENLTLAGLVEFVALFAIVWWIWLSLSYFADVFDTGDPVSVAMIIASMFGLVFLSGTVGSAFHGASFDFAVTVLLLRGYLTAAHVRARHLRRQVDADERRFLNYWIGLELLVTGVWGLSLLVPEPGRYGLWLAALVISVAGITTIYLNFRRVLGPEVSHCSERFGLFTILVLGETVLAVALGTSVTAFTPVVVLVSALAFAIVVMIWWFYFYRYDERIYGRLLYVQNEHWKRLRPRGITYVYSHVLVHAGIVVTGVGIAVGLESAVSQHALPLGGRLALTLGLATFLVGTGLAQWMTLPSMDGRVGAGRLSLVGFCGLLAVGGGALSPAALLAVVALATFALLLFEGRNHEDAPAPAPSGSRPEGTS